MSTAAVVQNSGAGRPSIGRPLPNTRAYVLDEMLRPLPVGAEGDLCVAGASLGRGYLHDPALTADRYVPDPFAATPGSRMYRTGDRARWLPSGELEFLGRLDLQVKVQGVRIELAEIEATLSAHPSVVDCAVVKKRDGQLMGRLVAYALRRSSCDRAAAAPDLREHLRRKLPSTMVPALVIEVPDLPRGASGKIDRAVLAARPDLEIAASTGERPLTATELMVATAWEQVLGLQVQDATADFFALGGHSLLATQLVERIRIASGVELPLAVVFEATTLGAMAARVDQLRATCHDDTALLESHAPEGGRAAMEDSSSENQLLSFAEERLWFLAQVGDADPSYAVPCALRMRGLLDCAALQASLDRIHCRHDILRTTYATSPAGRPKRQIAASSTMPLDVVNLCDLAPKEQDAALQRELQVLVQTPFDLERGPLLRLRLFRLSPTDHLLGVVAHHIVCDAASVRVLLDDVAAGYTTARGGIPLRLDRAPQQYADFAAREQREMAGARFEQRLTDWCARLAQAPKHTELPVDRPYPAAPNARGGHVRLALDPHLASAIDAAALAAGTTRFVFLLAAFKLLLRRHSRQSDILVGFPVSGRITPEVAEAVGCFANIVPICSHVDLDASGRDLISLVGQMSRDAIAHQDIPFQKLVQRLRPSRDGGRSPLVQAMFSYLEDDRPRRLDMLEVEVRALDTGIAKVELTLDVQASGDALELDVEYRTDIFERRTAVRLAERYRQIVTSLASGLDKRLRDLAYIPSDERTEMLVCWNETATDNPREVSVRDLFRQQVERTPNAPALCSAGWRATYRELDEAATRCAQWLRARGVRRGDVVGICLESSPDFIILMLAVLEAGSAYLPLDPVLPRERLLFMVQDATAKLVLTREGLMPLLAEAAVPLFAASEPLTAPAFVTSGAPRLDAASGDDLAYVLYTSGSTGRPKGVMVTHAGLLNYVWWAAHSYRTAEGAGAVLHSSFGADMTVTSIFPPLVVGGSVFVLPHGVDPSAVGDLDVPRPQSPLTITPGHLDFLARTMRPERMRDWTTALLIGGEALSPSTVAFWQERAPGTRLYNEYGPTEAVVACVVHEITTRQDPALPVPIGRPIANTQIYLVDDTLQPVPIGAVGEIAIGGAGLARGYLGRPDLTAAHFVPDPFGKAPGGRLYLTGDRARYRHDGVIEYLGRDDDQVKVRGYRVELGEIDSALRLCSGIAECCTVALRDPSGNNRLVAYLVATEGAEATPAGLRRELRQRLPAYLIPSRFIPVVELPLTVNGKIDRRRLPPPTDEDTAPTPALQSATERIIAQIWSALLGVSVTGVNDDFFEIGGHSLAAAQLVARLKAQLGLDLPVRAVFDAPRLQELGALIDQRLSEPGVATIATLPTADRTMPLPLSFAEERFWFLQQMQPASPAYHIPACVRLSGEIDPERLRAAVDAVVARHEILRTGFEQDETGAVVRRIHDAVPVDIGLIDLCEPDDACRENQMTHLLTEQTRRPFDLRRPPLFRVALLSISPREHVLALTVHHIIADATAISALIAEIDATYGAASPATTSAPLRQYADFAAWERGAEAQRQQEAERAYWQVVLHSAPDRVALPTDHPNQGAAPSGSSTLRLEIGGARSAALRTLARAQRATPFMATLATFVTFLRRISGQTDIVVGVPVSRRSAPELEGALGVFLNTLAIRIDVGDEPTFRELLERVRAATLEGQAHGDYPFDKVAELLRGGATTDLRSGLNVMCAFEEDFLPGNKVLGLPAHVIDVDTGAGRFDLLLHVRWNDGGCVLTFEYATDLFERDTMIRLAGCFERLLDAACATPDARIERLPIIAEAERLLLLTRWNPVAAGKDHTPELLHASVNAQAARSPNATAVRAQDGDLSYAELVARANQLSHHLAALGVARGDLVGVCLRRTRDLPVALLGVLGAGAAYVPLDPDHPAERLSFVLADAKVSLLVTERALANRIPAGGFRIVSIDDDACDIAARPRESFISSVSADDLAYIIYTSGSTGRPKGVMLEHRSAARFIDWATTVYSLDELHRVLGGTSITFDLSIFELFAPLSCGGSMDLVDNVLALAHWRGRDEITLVNTVPSAMSELVAMGALAQSVRVVNLAGEPLPGHLARAIRVMRPGCRIYNLYGPSEDTTYSTFDEVAEGDERPTIGLPLTGRRAYVLDAHLEPVPVGIVGEIYLGGEGLARGYWARPDLTAALFVPDPFSTTGGERLYRTGDLARRRADGRLEFLGRGDHQIKLRGYRIDLGEITTVLGEHPSIVETVVTAPPGAETSGLCAYVVLASGACEDLLQLQADLGARLPKYMIPGSWVRLPTLPRLPNGKIDRKALPPPTSGDATAVPVAPGNPLESQLLSIWSEILGRGGFGVADDFFGLGGHSLLVARLSGRITGTFGVDVSLAELFQHPTISQQAALLAARAGYARARLERAESAETPAPLSFAQERLWFMAQLDPTSAAYNISEVLRLSGTLDAAALIAALRTVVVRHPVLRTHYLLEGGRVMAHTLPADDVEIRQVDLSDRPGGEALHEALRRAVDDAAQPFDLAAVPPFRATLARISGDTHVLTIVTHHIAFDGSHEQFARALTDAYRAYRAEEPPADVPLPLPYADFARWQRARMTGDVLDSHLAYWRQRLGGTLPTLQLPTDRPRPPVRTSRGGRHAFQLSTELSGRLETFARGMGTTLFQTLLAGFWALLGRVSEQQDVLVAVPMTDRAHIDAATSIGNYVNTVVHRGDLGGDPCFSAVVSQARAIATEALPHAALPFNLLVEALQPERDLSQPPIAQVMLTVSPLDEPIALPDINVESLDVGGAPTARFDLLLALGHGRSGIHGMIEYSADIFDHESAVRLCDQFVTLLDAAVRTPETPISHLPLIDQARQRALIDDWNAAVPSSDDQTRTLHQLFEQRADDAPDAVAVVAGSTVLTYAQVERRANQLAHQLREQGVSRGDKVAVLLPRGPELVPSLLAILKAGGCYVPLQADAPAARLRAILDSLDVCTIVTGGHFASIVNSLRPDVPRLEHTIVIDDLSQLDGAPDHRPTPVATPDDLAYVIFTSGSTGTPKGVVIRHHPAWNTIDWVNRTYAVGPTDRLLFVTSTSFDLSVYDMFGTLAAGASIRIASEDEVRDPRALARILAEEPITFWDSAPATLAQCVPFFAGNAGGTLRLAFLSGDWIPVSLPDQIRARFPSAQVVSLGGATEAAIWSNHYPIGAVDGGWSSIPYGRPIQRARYYVLDQHLAPCPIGIPGDLYIGGNVLADGYYGDPALTSDKFLPDPFAPMGGRMYSTGDRARHRPDGNLEFLGRRDQQVKIRGFRVELGEIEKVLAAHPAVREAAVVAHGDKVDLSLHAYVVPTSGAAATVAALRAHLRAHLPEYMIPAAFAMCDALPLTRNGKLDRGALPPITTPPAPTALVAPRDELERQIAEEWCAVLGVASVSVEDNFFDLGGNSLRVVEVRHRLEGRLCRPLAIVDLFQHTTVRSLATHLRAKAGALVAPDGTSARTDAVAAGKQRLRDQLQRKRRRP